MTPASVIVSRDAAANSRARATLGEPAEARQLDEWREAGSSDGKSVAVQA